MTGVRIHFTRRLRIIREHVRSLFVFVRSEDPAEPSFRGRPVFDEEGCVGCGACAVVCPSNAIRIFEPDLDEEDSRRMLMRRIELNVDRCLFCGRCENACITRRGIRFRSENAPALFDRRLAVESVEKEIRLCGRCGVVITTLDHLRWMRYRLGLLAFGNPLLITADEAFAPSEGPFRPLCGRCRFEAVSEKSGS